MALGFGFNKTKVLASAEKYVQQGKIQNAINEYEKVIKEEPKDLTVLNTVGDLYARVGNSDRAVAYFKRVGDTYASDGFTVKAIAMYKKLTKLTPSNTDAVLKLAALYTQQGLYNDARAQYMIIADQFLKTSDLDGAARMFQKMLELDPENASMQSKLADLYVRMGKKKEAVTIFLGAAQSLYARGAFEPSDEALGRVLKLEPTNPDALLLRGQIAADSGNGEAAIAALEHIADLDSRPDGLRALLRAHVAMGRRDDAMPIAQKLLHVHNDISGITMLAEWLLSSGDVAAALRLYDQHADRFLSAYGPGLMQNLHSSIGRIKDDAKSLELLRGLYLKAGETTQLAEINELLAHALVQAGELPRARDIYKELADLEPENTLHLQSYKQVVAMLGEDATTRPLTPEEGAQALMVDELEQTALEVHQEYPEELEAAIKAALTDSELFDSYNAPLKAIGPLEGILPKAPTDIRVNQRLASLYARADRYRDAALCCENLNKVYSLAGHAELALQYADMAAKYHDRAPAEAPVAAAAASSAIPEPPPAPAAAEFSMEVAPPEVAPAPAPSGGEVSFEVTPATGSHEIDLSSEWEGMTAVEPTPPAAAPTSQFIGQAAAAGAAVEELLQEARFFVSQSMWTEATTALERCEAAAPGHAEVAALRQQVEAAAAAPAAPEFAAASGGVSEFVFESVAEPAAAPVAFEAEPPSPEVAAPPAPPPLAEPEPVAAAPKSDDLLGDLVLDLEESLGDDFGIAKPAAKPPAAASQPPAPPPVPAAPAPAPVPEMSASPAAVTPTNGETSSALSDMFAEFKEDVEETSKEAEDPETHYNLGVAFKEMGLLDEAIGELQKVCQAIDRGQAFSQSIQAYTWLAQCFLEKGVPQAAIKWYERALKSGGVDEESRLAIYYELASAHEAAGNQKAALDSFMEVYGSNIDYRDVAERIKALKS